jgi:hypothetical protein
MPLNLPGGAPGGSAAPNPPGAAVSLLATVAGGGGPYVEPPPPPQTVTQVTTTGPHTFTIGTDIPANAGNVLVELAGGGGGGAGGGTATTDQGGGGGSAGYSSAVLPAGLIASAGTLVVTVGTGGPGVTAENAGIAGTISKAVLDGVQLVDNTGGSGAPGAGAGAGGHAGFSAPAVPANLVDGSQGGNGGAQPGSGASGTAFLPGTPGAGGNGGPTSSGSAPGGNGKARLTYPVPLVTSVTIQPDGHAVVWVFDRVMSGSGAGFSLKQGGTTRTLTYVSGSGTDTLHLTSATTIPGSIFVWHGQYTPGDMQSAAGAYPLYRINQAAVTNNSAQ